MKEITKEVYLNWYEDMQFWRKFEDKLIANLDQPVFGLATGQALVIYDGDRVVGSATICETI
jgi:tRNA U34 2-thiouridine synthase MnmA/TrmU